MNHITALGHRFFLFGGVILIACAILQWLARPRSQHKPSVAQLVSATALRAVLFVAVGILAILVGTGTIPMAGGR
jgi:hypothetical protein